MVRQFPLLAADGAQIIPIPGGDVGFREIHLAFAIAPSAGTVTVEQRAIGSDDWVALNRGTAVDVTPGELTLYADGSAGAMRVTFSGLTGGSSPLLWVSSQATAVPPLDILTDGGTGPNARFRVDQGQTGLFARRVWRISHEFTGLNTTPLVLKVVVPVNFMLYYQGLSVDAGGVVLRAYRSTQGTEGGTFSTAIPLISANTMTEEPEYTFQAAVTTGGTFTPSAPPAGTAVETLRVLTSGATAQQSTVGGEAVNERGLAAGTYYLVFSRMTGVSGDCAGVYTLIVEERPNGSQMPFP